MNDNDALVGEDDSTSPLLGARSIPEAADARRTARFPDYYQSWAATRSGGQAACLSEALDEGWDPTPAPFAAAKRPADDADFDWDADTLVRTVT